MFFPQSIYFSSFFVFPIFFVLLHLGGHRPVCSYVTPLSAGRLLDSPRHAARFVSLIPYTKVDAVGTGSGAGRMEVWNHFHTFLSLGRGDCEDHAILLCSLLLGFGLDAYVCVGTVREPNGDVRDHGKSFKKKQKIKK